MSCASPAAQALGAEWAAFSGDEKAPFMAQAEARKAADLAANGGAPAKLPAVKKRPAPAGGALLLRDETRRLLCSC